MKNIPFCAGLMLLLAGCAGVSMPSMLDLWPFGAEKGRELSRTPANSTAYLCDQGKRLYVRLLENGAAVWVILPEREFRLDKAPGGDGTRYGSGKAVLTLRGDEVTLTDGPTVSYAGCRPPKPAAG